MKKELIINADDFGLSDKINQGIVDAYLNGIVTSTTFMLNMPGEDNAVELAKKNKSLDVGLHINLTWGKPISNIADVSTITKNGKFYNKLKLFKSFIARKINPLHIEREIRAQIERYLSFDLSLTHVDTHQHIIIIPIIYKIILKLAKEYNIPFVRFPFESYKASLKAFTLQNFLIMNSILYGNIPAYNKIKYFSGVSITGKWDKIEIINFLDNLKEGITELMCHPGYNDLGLTDNSSKLVESREIELNILTDSVVKRKIIDKDITMINFKNKLKEIQNAK